MSHRSEAISQTQIDDLGWYSLADPSGQDSSMISDFIGDPDSYGNMSDGALFGEKEIASDQIKDASLGIVVGLGIWGSGIGCQAAQAYIEQRFPALKDSFVTRLLDKGAKAGWLGGISLVGTSIA